MFNAISSQGGIVSVMAADGLMAVFGAPLPLPDHCAAAVRAALEMIELIELFNAEPAAAGKTTIRIGIASGEMVAGYTGTNERATYTCIGDMVNIASRLEGHTKQAGRPILIDAATRAGLASDALLEALGPVTVRGKTQPVEVFAVDAGREA
jgi:adenylate cyclase